MSGYLCVIASFETFTKWVLVNTVIRTALGTDELKYSGLFSFSIRLCRFCVVIGFFHPLHNGQWPTTSKNFHPRFYPLHFMPILILEKEPVFPFLMFSAKQDHYWYHFYNVFGMTRSLTEDWTRDLPH